MEFDLRTATEKHLQLLSEWGIQTLSTVQAALAVDLAQNELTAAQLLQSLEDVPELDQLSAGQKSEIVGDLLSIPLMQNTLSAVGRIEDGKIYYTAAREIRSRLRELRVCGLTGEYNQLLALQIKSTY